MELNMKNKAPQKQTAQYKVESCLAVQIDWSDDEICDLISLKSCKRKVLEAYAKANPKKTITLLTRTGESCDFGDLCNVLYYAATNSELLIEKLEKKLRNAGFRVRLCYVAVNKHEIWLESATITDGAIIWHIDEF